MNEDRIIPDRFSAEKSSPYYFEGIGAHVGIAINGEVQHGTVVEYCVSGSWARVMIRRVDGSFLQNPGRKGEFLVKKVYGLIRVWWKDEEEPPYFAKFRLFDRQWIRQYLDIVKNWDVKLRRFYKVPIRNEDIVLPDASKPEEPAYVLFEGRIIIGKDGEDVIGIYCHNVPIAVFGL